MSHDPKIFISYSWTTPAHEKWVISLAEELLSQGVDVIIDKWNLKPGNDANAFMETMVTDTSVTKVLLICDRKYVEKSDSRLGGAGTEAQIITPQLYAKRGQDRFVAVVREQNDDGTPCLPVYYKGRIYFDLSDDTKYAQEFEGLVRWAWDKPAYVKPEIGKKPSFLSDTPDSIKLPTSAAFRRAHDLIRNDRGNAEAATAEYLDVFATELERFRTTAEIKEGEYYDQNIVDNIEQFIPYRNELIDLFISIYRPSNEMIAIIHRFIEKIEHYMRRPEHIHSYREADFDNYRFIIHEIFIYLIATMLKYERFELVSHIMNTEYYTDEHRDNPMNAYTVLYQHTQSFDDRSRRLRRLSSRADLLKERSQSTGIEFKHIIAADFVLYISSLTKGDWSIWWPETLIFMNHHPAPIEIFARAKSAAYFKKIAPILGVTTKEELTRNLTNIDPQRLPRWQYNRINPATIVRLDDLATTP